MDEISNEKLNLIMSILKECDIKLNKASVGLLIDEGICTQEAPIWWYCAARNINNALTRKENSEEIIKTNLTDEQMKLVYTKFVKYA